METIYSIIQRNPQYFAWAFGIVNALWVLFVYFNKKSHERAMANLRHSLNLDLERRKKVFEMKANQYELYVQHLDEFGKKYQVQMPSRMQPIFSKYLKGYLEASENGDKEKEREVIAWLSEQVSALMNESTEEYLKLKSEANSLKLTSNDELLRIFDELEKLTEASMKLAYEFMGKFTEITLTQNQVLSHEYQSKLASFGQGVQQKAEQLMKGEERGSDQAKYSIFLTISLKKWPDLALYSPFCRQKEQYT